MSEEESADNTSELETLAALPRANEPSARKKLTVSFDNNLTQDVDRQQTHSQTRRPSFLEQSWHRKDSSTRVKDSNKFISFHDIVYQVPVRKWCRKQPPKVILHEVRYVHMLYTYIYCLSKHCIVDSGIMKSGLNAIMGPSGSGKTRYSIFSVY